MYRGIRLAERLSEPEKLVGIEDKLDVKNKLRREGV